MAVCLGKIDPLIWLEFAAVLPLFPGGIHLDAVHVVDGERFLSEEKDSLGYPQLLAMV